MELIDRKRAIKAILDLPNCPNGFSDMYDKARIISELKELPTIDAVEVRCKDCKHNSLAREILAELTGMTVNDTTNQLTKRLIFGRDRDPQSKFNLGERREADEH